MNQDAKDPSLPEDAEELHEALTELVRVYQFRDRQCICCHDISVTQCHALDLLIRVGPSPLTRLASDLYLDKSTASRVADTLERKGYLKRKQDPNDRRSVRLEITRKGRQLHQKIEQSLIEEKKSLLSDFDPEIRQATTRLIARLARAAKDRFGC